MARPSPGSDDHSNTLGINDKCTKPCTKPRKQLSWCLQKIRASWGERRSHHIAKVAKFLDFNKLHSCKYGRKKRKKMTCMTFPCIIALWNNSRTCFSSIVRQCKWLSLLGKIFEIQKFCYHGNVMSHFSITWSFVHFLLIGKDKLSDS